MVWEMRVDPAVFNKQYPYKMDVRGNVEEIQQKLLMKHGIESMFENY